MHRFKLFALILPVLIPLLLVGKIAYERSHAPVYKVRIVGYDPRDLLYGRYITFRYDVEQSEDREAFPENMSDIVERLPRRFYMDERRARAAENILRDEEYRVEIGVGVPPRGSAFIEDLYVDGEYFRDFIRDHQE